MRTCPEKTSAASVKAAVICTYCDPSSRRRRSCRSAIDAADEREQQDRQLPEEIVEPKEERGLGEVEDEPALRDLLHPRADGRRERAEPEHAEIPVGEGGERALQEGLREQGTASRSRSAAPAATFGCGLAKRPRSYNSQLIRSLRRIGGFRLIGARRALYSAERRRKSEIMAARPRRTRIAAAHPQARRHADVGRAVGRRRARCRADRHRADRRGARRRPRARTPVGNRGVAIVGPDDRRCAAMLAAAAARGEAVALIDPAIASIPRRRRPPASIVEAACGCAIPATPRAR